MTDNNTVDLRDKAEAAGIIVDKINFILNEVYRKTSIAAPDDMWIRYSFPFIQNMGHIVMDYMDELKPLIRNLIDDIYAMYRGGGNNE